MMKAALIIQLLIFRDTLVGCVSGKSGASIAKVMLLNKVHSKIN